LCFSALAQLVLQTFDGVLLDDACEFLQGCENFLLLLDQDSERVLGRARSLRASMLWRENKIADGAEHVVAFSGQPIVEFWQAVLHFVGTILGYCSRSTARTVSCVLQLRLSGSRRWQAF
jgi:hypothetical protein